MTSADNPAHVMLLILLIMSHGHLAENAMSSGRWYASMQCVSRPAPGGGTSKGYPAGRRHQHMLRGELQAARSSTFASMHDLQCCESSAPQHRCSSATAVLCSLGMKPSAWAVDATPFRVQGFHGSLACRHEAAVVGCEPQHEARQRVRVQNDVVIEAQDVRSCFGRRRYPRQYAAWSTKTAGS